MSYKDFIVVTTKKQRGVVFILDSIIADNGIFTLNLQSPVNDDFTSIKKWWLNERKVTIIYDTARYTGIIFNMSKIIPVRKKDNGRLIDDFSDHLRPPSTLLQSIIEVKITS